LGSFGGIFTGGPSGRQMVLRDKGTSRPGGRVSIHRVVLVSFNRMKPPFGHPSTFFLYIFMVTSPLTGGGTHDLLQSTYQSVEHQ
jgi:hypothetical protein